MTISKMANTRNTPSDSETGEMVTFEQIKALTFINNSTLYGVLINYRDYITVSKKGTELLYRRKDVEKYLSHLINP